MGVPQPFVESINPKKALKRVILITFLSAENRFLPKICFCSIASIFLLKVFLMHKNDLKAELRWGSMGFIFS